MLMTARIAVLFILIAMPIPRSAVAASPYLWVDNGSRLSKYQFIFVEPVTNDAAGSFELDVVELIRENIQKELGEAQFQVLSVPSDAADMMLVRANLTLYEPGSAASRWLAPHTGATKCVLRVRLVDAASKQLIGDMVVAKYVGAGGLFTAGADKTVLENAAEELATAIRQRIEREVKSR